MTINTTLRDTLRWLIEARTLPPEVPPELEDQLLYLVVLHRLTHRFARKLTCGDASGTFSRRLVARVLHASATERRVFDRQFAAVRELADAMRDIGQSPPLIVKGLALYARTGDPSHLPISYDVDVFHGELPALVSALERIGFHSYWDGHERAHEMTAMRREGVTLEVHRCLESWAYPINLRDQFPSDAPLCRDLVVWYNSKVGLWYRDIVAHCSPGVARGTEGVLVPSVTLTALITCVHAFGNYTEPGYWALRLSEIATIRDCFLHREFDTDLFAQFVDRFAARDSISYVSTVFRELYGEVPEGLNLSNTWLSEPTPNPSLKGREPEVTSPQPSPWKREGAEVTEERGRGGCGLPVRLSYGGGWAVPFSVDELLLPLLERDIVARLMPAHVIASPVGSDPAAVYANRSAGVRLHGS
ncbi:MAG: nucleotidyltransferase family protein [Capsulimonadaceae bacterium]